LIFFLNSNRINIKKPLIFSNNYQLKTNDFNLSNVIGYASDTIFDINFDSKNVKFNLEFFDFEIGNYSDLNNSDIFVENVSHDFDIIEVYSSLENF
jgi:hypothetical protein